MQRTPTIHTLNAIFTVWIFFLVFGLWFHTIGQLLLNSRLLSDCSQSKLMRSIYMKKLFHRRCHNNFFFFARNLRLCNDFCLWLQPFSFSPLHGSPYGCLTASQKKQKPYSQLLLLLWFFFLHFGLPSTSKREHDWSTHVFTLPLCGWQRWRYVDGSGLSIARVAFVCGVCFYSTRKMCTSCSLVGQRCRRCS